eukprot:PhF_6_TR30550/c0_g1_i3/m.44844
MPGGNAITVVDSDDEFFLDEAPANSIKKPPPPPPPPRGGGGKGPSKVGAGIILPPRPPPTNMQKPTSPPPPPPSGLPKPPPVIIPPTKVMSPPPPPPPKKILSPLPGFSNSSPPAKRVTITSNPTSPPPFGGLQGASIPDAFRSKTILKITNSSEIPKPPPPPPPQSPPRTNSSSNHSYTKNTESFDIKVAGNTQNIRQSKRFSSPQRRHEFDSAAQRTSSIPKDIKPKPKHVWQDVPIDIFVPSGKTAHTRSDHKEGGRIFYVDSRSRKSLTHDAEVFRVVEEDDAYSDEDIWMKAKGNHTHNTHHSPPSSPSSPSSKKQQPKPQQPEQQQQGPVSFGETSATKHAFGTQTEPDYTPKWQPREPISDSVAWSIPQSPRAQQQSQQQQQQPVQPAAQGTQAPPALSISPSNTTSQDILQEFLLNRLIAQYLQNPTVPRHDLLNASQMSRDVGQRLPSPATSMEGAVLDSDFSSRFGLPAPPMKFTSNSLDYNQLRNVYDAQHPLHQQHHYNPLQVWDNMRKSPEVLWQPAVSGSYIPPPMKLRSVAMSNPKYTMRSPYLGTALVPREHPFFQVEGNVNPVDHFGLNNNISSNQNRDTLDQRTGHQHSSHGNHGHSSHSSNHGHSGHSSHGRHSNHGHGGHSSHSSHGSHSHS